MDPQLVIRGGAVCDGSGREPFAADVFVRDGRIAVVASREGGAAPPSPAGAVTIDASGQVVSPGFIDLHSHSDLIFPIPEARRDALLEGRIRQGITTEILGNCGLGPSPSTPDSAPIVRGVLAWMTPDGAGASWASVGEYLDTLERVRVPINVGTLAAHGSIRLAAMGLRAGEADAAEMRAMTGAVERALGDGAFGLSSGLIYPPGMFAPTRELAALARPLARAGRLYTSHVRGSSELLFESVEELLSIGRDAGCRVHHSHSEAVGREHWWKIEQVLEREERARRDGIRVSFDMFPYPVAATMMIAIYPPWSLEGGVTALLARLRDRATRERIRLDIERVIPSWPPWREAGWPHNLVSAVGWSGIAVSRVSSAANRPCEGMTLAELGGARSRPPFEAISDLMIEEEGEVGQWVFEISGEAGLHLLARDPAGAFCTDAIDTGRGLPHPAAFGAFPLVLARIVRERRALSLGEAIRKLTAYPAEILGLSDRGRIAPGMAADLVIFDPEAVEDTATLAAPRRHADGIPHVLVNGSPVVSGGRFIGGTAGHVLRAS